MTKSVASPYMEDEDLDDEFQHRDAEIAKAYVEENLSMDTVGLRYGLSRERIRQILAKQGVEPRKRWVLRNLEERACAREGCDEKFTPKSRYSQQRYHSKLCARQSQSEAMRFKRREEMKELIKAGEDDTKIAQKLGCSANTVVRYRREMGIFRNPFKSRLKDPALKQARKSAIIYLRDEVGLNSREVAEIFGHDPRYIRQIVKGGWE